MFEQYQTFCNKSEDLVLDAVGYLTILYINEGKPTLCYVIVSSRAVMTPFCSIIGLAYVLVLVYGAYGIV